jgi:hypothetical protein
MTIPAKGIHIHVVVTLVAKLGFVGVAIHAGDLKALVVNLAVVRRIIPLPVSNHLMPPFVEETHVGFSHILGLFDADLGFLGLGRQFRVRGFGGLSCVVIEGKQEQP